jgi:rhodanese-related sulfurtransferase
MMTTIRIRELDAQTARTWLDEGDSILIDVREPAEHARERIEGATLAPLSTFDPANLDLKGKRRVIVHCAAGLRSSRAAEQLAASGIAEVGHLKGGLPAWKQAGFTTIVNQKAPLPLMRQVQIVAGVLILLGVILGALAHPGFYALAGFVGAGLLVAGVTGWCGMATCLAKLPYNRNVTA